MTKHCRLASISGANDGLLTRSWKHESLGSALTASSNVSWTNKLPIFCIYEAQSLDLFFKLVRISEASLSQVGRLRFAPIELFVARQRRFRGRSRGSDDNSIFWM